MKEHLRTCLGNIFICVTLINVAILVLGCMLEPDVKFGYVVFAYPLILLAIIFTPLSPVTFLASSTIFFAISLPYRREPYSFTAAL